MRHLPLCPKGLSRYRVNAGGPDGDPASARKKSGSARGKAETHASSRKGGRLGGKAAAKRPTAKRSASARQAAATRKRRASA
jgi:hypothetical protein